MKKLLIFLLFLSCSSEEVQNIVSKINAFKYVILTEHLPNEDFKPNKNIISGQGIRLKKKSGINVLLPPFNLKIVKEKQLLSITPENTKGRIVTTLYQMY